MLLTKISSFVRWLSNSISSIDSVALFQHKLRRRRSAVDALSGVKNVINRITKPSSESVNSSKSTVRLLIRTHANDQVIPLVVQNSTFLMRLPVVKVSFRHLLRNDHAICIELDTDFYFTGLDATANEIQPPSGAFISRRAHFAPYRTNSRHVARQVSVAF